MITIKEDKRSTSPLGINDINLDISTEWSNVNKQEYSILISAMNNKEYEEYINVSDSIELSTRDNPILNDIKVCDVVPDHLTKEMVEYIKSLGNSIKLSQRDNPILVYNSIKPDRLSVGKKHRVLPNVPKRDRTNLGYQY